MVFVILTRKLILYVAGWICRIRGPPITLCNNETIHPNQSPSSTLMSMVLSPDEFRFQFQTNIYADYLNTPYTTTPTKCLLLGSHINTAINAINKLAYFYDLDLDREGKKMLTVNAI